MTAAPCWPSTLLISGGVISWGGFVIMVLMDQCWVFCLCIQGISDIIVSTASSEIRGSIFWNPNKVGRMLTLWKSVSNYTGPPLLGWGFKSEPETI